MFDCQRLANAIDAYIAKADGDLADVLNGEGYADPEETAKIISDIEDAVAEALDEQTELFLSSAKKSVDLAEFAESVMPGVKLTDDLAVKVAEIFQEQLTDIMPGLISSYITLTDKELKLEQVSKRTTAWVSDWSEELGEIMQLNSHTEIERILTTGLSEGYGIQQFVEDIMNSGVRDSHYKARRVAVTEVLRAHSVAREEGIQQSPAVEHKEWVHTGSYRNEPRPNHVSMSGQVVAKEEPFTLYGADGGIYYPAYPRDTELPASESVNCHCIHRGIASESVLGLSLEERRRLQAEAVADMDDEWEKELNERNKAKAGIDSNVPDSVRGTKTELGRLSSFDKTEQVKYMGGKQKWALYQSGVITDDDMLLKVKSTKLTDLNDSGIITIKSKIVNHSSIGAFTPKSERLVSGGHGQDNIAELNLKGTRIDIKKTYSNGVRIGGVENHKNANKQIGTTGQSWFPDSWSKDDILVAGTYIANNQRPADGVYAFTTYNGVRVGIIFDGKGGGTIFPDNSTQPYNGGWEVNEYGK